MLAIRTRSRRLFPPGALRPPTSAAGFGCRAILRRGSIGCAGSRSREEARAAFLAEVKDGAASFDLLRHPLLPYQREGMLHLAFGERALLADEMGLGKTVQAIAACELLARRKGIERVLVVCPASLKAEWEEQIARFTDALGALGLRGPAGAPRRLPRAHILHHRELRAGAGRRRRHQRDPASRRGRARRGAAHQELADQDGAAGEVAALALRLRADRHAGREPHRRALFDRPVPRSRNCSGRCSASTATSTSSTSAAGRSTTRISPNCGAGCSR